jgi:hypothetical protein
MAEVPQYWTEPNHLSVDRAVARFHEVALKTWSYFFFMTTHRSVFHCEGPLPSLEVLAGSREFVLDHQRYEATVIIAEREMAWCFLLRSYDPIFHSHAAGEEVETGTSPNGTVVNPSSDK